MSKYAIRDYGDNETIVADSATELVSVIREHTPYAIGADDAEFMSEFAAQLHLQSGDAVRSDTAENFVEDLIAVGFLKEIGDGETKDA
jgi:hypothetical protein